MQLDRHLERGGNMGKWEFSTRTASGRRVFINVEVGTAVSFRPVIFYEAEIGDDGRRIEGRANFSGKSSWICTIPWIATTLIAIRHLFAWAPPGGS